jgi:DNA-binding GntR family transcriptional regulator
MRGLNVSTGSSQAEFHHLQLKDRVYEYLRRGIINNDFPVGAALREVDIATSLGVSKTPVREAFVRLQKDRFVDLIPYRGAVVSGYSSRDLREIYEIRELLEGRCAARAAESEDDEFRRELTRNVEQSRLAYDEGRIDELIALFEEFDKLIFSQADNSWMSELIQDFDGHQRRIGRLTVEIPGRLEHSIAEHQQVCSAIMQGDPVAAERLMGQHVISVMADQLDGFVDQVSGAAPE